MNLRTNLNSISRVILGSIIAVMTASTCTEAKSPLAIFNNSHDVVKLEVASSEQEITRGLMFRTSMPEDAGMVFLFDPPRPVNFWMYHTLIPLDMLFVKDGKIIRLFENVPPCKSQDGRNCPRYPEGDGITVTEVVEVNSGYAKRHGIKEGDPIRFSLQSASNKSQAK